LLLTGLTITFLKEFGLGLCLSLPLSLSLASTVALLGLVVGRKEGWSRFDSVYWSFITATTVGYGDIRLVKSIEDYCHCGCTTGANTDRHFDCGGCACRDVGTRGARCYRGSQVRAKCPPARHLHKRVTALLLQICVGGAQSGKKVWRVTRVAVSSKGISHDR
jgi:hypothetical protein